MKFQRRTIHGLMLSAVLSFFVIGNRNFEAGDLLLIDPIKQVIRGRIEPLYFYPLVGFVACLVGLGIRILKGSFFEPSDNQDMRHHTISSKSMKQSLPKKSKTIGKHFSMRNRRY